MNGIIILRREWSFNNGYDTNLTIDRIDNNSNYETPNCRWITQSENSKKAHCDKSLWFHNE